VTNRSESAKKAIQFRLSPGGVPSVVKGIIDPAIARNTGSMARVSKIKGVNPG
jgi:hypothetical protein